MGPVDPGALQALARHAEAVATARAFAAAAQAQRVVLLLDRGPGADTVMVDCDADGAVELTEGEETWVLPASAALPAPSLALPEIRPAPATAMSVDPETGELAAPLGVVQHLADAVLALARACGGRSVASAEFATRDPELPILLAAREGEGMVLAAGGHEFELPGAR
jgi:hypothetical protein